MHSGKKHVDSFFDFYLTPMPKKERDNLASQASTNYQEGETFFKAGKYEEAIPFYEAALKIFQTIDALYQDIFYCCENIARCYMTLADENPDLELKAVQLSDAKQYFELAISYYSSRVTGIAMKGVSPREKYTHLEFCHTRLMDLYKEEKNFEETIYHAKKALKAAREGYKEKPERIAICLYNLAACYGLMKNYSRAIPYLSEALTLYKKLQKTDTVKSLEEAIKYFKEEASKPKVLFTAFNPPSHGTSVVYEYGESNLYLPEAKTETPKHSQTVFSFLSNSPRASATLSNISSISPQPSPANSRSS